MTSIWVRWMNHDTLMKHQMKHHQVFIWDKHFLLFHLRRHVKNSGFVLHHGFHTPRNRWKHSACGLMLSSVSRCLQPVMKHSPSFLTYYFMVLTWNYAISLTNYAKETQLNEIQNGGWRAYILLITLISNEVYVVRIFYGFSLRELCFLRDRNIKGSTIRNTVYQTQNKTNRNIF